ncbi:MAG: hypothetical protein QM572_10955 [Nocardioides sp.]|uniref:hypothetical protein n=1 Tax=Nocardioides sp. TaxID=35761 RepID=UPI0039E708B0
MSLRIDPITSGLAATALAVTGLTIAPGSARAATSPTPAPEASAAATWLASVIGSDGLIPGGGLDGYFYSANLDFGISLAATGQAPSAALTKLEAGVDATVASWIGDVSDASNAGKVAKAAYYYAVTGGDPADAGDEHLDLVSALTADVDDSTGQLGSYESAYNQVWAVMALHELGNAEATKARDFLVSERGPASTDGWGYEYDGWNNDPDATSWAVKALAPWSSTSSVSSAIAGGVSYLTSVQGTTGGIDAGYLGVNANSTGAAAAAFGAVGETAAAALAADWVVNHQIVSLPDCGIAPANGGAIAYNDDDLAAGVSDDNIATAGPATAQAIEGLAYLTPTTPAVSAPTGFVAAGSTISVPVSGLRTGQQACLSGGTTAAKVTAPGSVAVTLPAGTATRTITLTTVGSTTTAAVKALAAAKLKVAAKSTVKRGRKLKVTVRGLAAGEKVTVKLGRKAFGTAVADATGKATLSRKVAKRTTTGRKKITVVGAFANRTGGDRVKVTR